jgi:O-antigen/teichoic acid export membrane protein
VIRRPAWAAAGTAVGNALLVGIGLAIVGAASFVSLGLAARSLGDEEFAAYATWWTSATLVGLAFTVVESYLPRLLMSFRVEDADQRPLVATFSRGTLTAAALVALVVLATAPWSVDRLYDGRPELVALLVVYLLAMSLQSLQRAIGVGREAFKVFPAQLGVDGSVRVAGAVVAAVAGTGQPAVFAGVMVLGAVAGLVAGGRALPHWFSWPQPLARVALAPLGLLLVASLGPLIVNNAGVPWMTAQGAPALAIGAVTGALALSRLPTLMVGSAYGPVLAPLARAVERRAFDDFRAAHRRALTAAVVLAVLFVGIFVLVGPELLALYLGTRFQLDRAELAAMSTGSASCSRASSSKPRSWRWPPGSGSPLAGSSPLWASPPPSPCL